MKYVVGKDEVTDAPEKNIQSTKLDFKWQLFHAMLVDKVKIEVAETQSAVLWTIDPVVTITWRYFCAFIFYCAQVVITKIQAP